MPEVFTYTLANSARKVHSFAVGLRSQTTTHKLMIEQNHSAFMQAVQTKNEAVVRELYSQTTKKSLPRETLPLWITVHKFITATASLPMEFRRASKDWLTRRGLPSQDGGVL